MEKPSIAASVFKLVMAGEHVGFTVEQMIGLLKAGITVETLMDMIEWRLCGRVPERRSSRWVM